MEKVNKTRCLTTAIVATILISSLIPSMILTVSSSVITVPDDYPSIQEAVNAAQAKDTVFVRSGQYNETITVDKSLNLIGEDKETTIIDGNDAQRIILVNADYVNITGFTIQNTGRADVKSIYELAREDLSVRSA